MAAILGKVARSLAGFSNLNLCRQGHRGLHLWRQPGVSEGGADRRPLRPGPRPRLPHGQAGRVGRQRHHRGTAHTGKYANNEKKNLSRLLLKCQGMAAFGNELQLDLIVNLYNIFNVHLYI